MSEKDPNVSEYRQNSYSLDEPSPNAELKQPFENVHISKPFNPFPEAVVVDPVIAGRRFIPVRYSFIAIPLKSLRVRSQGMDPRCRATKILGRPTWHVLQRV